MVARSAAGPPGLPEWPFVNRPRVPALLFLHGIYRH
jgi:hypothetical protein